MHIFRGSCATTWPFETNHVLEFGCFSLKGGLKGKRWTWTMQNFHCTPMKRVTFPSSSLYSYCLCVLIWWFWWGNGVTRPRLIPFWCLMPKGEKIKARMINGSATTWEIFENGRLELLVCQNSFIVSYVKSWPLVGRSVDYGKRGVFGILDQISLENLSLCLYKWFWLRDRNLSLICKNKPSGGIEWSIYVKYESK
jgi:hypothetical protein